MTPSQRGTSNKKIQQSKQQLKKRKLSEAEVEEGASMTSSEREKQRLLADIKESLRQRRKQERAHEEEDKENCQYQNWLMVKRGITEMKREQPRRSRERWTLQSLDLSRSFESKGSRGEALQQEKKGESPRFADVSQNCQSQHATFENFNEPEAKSQSSVYQKIHQKLLAVGGPPPIQNQGSASILEEVKAQEKQIRRTVTGVGLRTGVEISISGFEREDESNKSGFLQQLLENEEEQKENKGDVLLPKLNINTKTPSKSPVRVEAQKSTELKKKLVGNKDPLEQEQEQEEEEEALSYITLAQIDDPSAKEFVQSIMAHQSQVEDMKQQIGKLEEEKGRREESQSVAIQELLQEKQERDLKISELQQKVDDMQYSLKHLLEDLRKSTPNVQSFRVDEIMRKQLHSYIQVLKGNMRVFCRVKPLSNENGLLGGMRKSTMQFRNCIAFPQRIPDQYPQQMEVVQSDQSVKLYHFDAIFPQDSSQEQVFKEVQSFIQSAVDGENVCIFAYGQTGAGKTFTMEGPNQMLLFDEETLALNELSGIIPRTAVFLLNEVERLKKQMRREYSLQVSSLEIYCDTIRDLFCREGNQTLNLATLKSNKVVVQNQTWMKVSSLADFLSLIKLSASKRIFSHNGAHDHSSRSHHVFQVKIRGQNKQFQEVESLLNIVDLAGSERRADQEKLATMPKRSKSAKRTKDNGQQNKDTLEAESIFINKSLTTLGRIFAILADKKAKNKQAPPYRESKLTRILQDSLTYDSKTLMIVNVCSGLEHVQQTKESLNFASQAMLAY